MRTREEIRIQASKAVETREDAMMLGLAAILEVLLDIREIQLVQLARLPGEKYKDEDGEIFY